MFAPPQGAARPQQQQPLPTEARTPPPRLRCLRCSLVWLTSTGRRGYAMGTPHVPGRGRGDTVHAMLTPGEAVLRPHVARAIGRGNIAYDERPAAVLPRRGQGGWRGAWRGGKGRFSQASLRRCRAALSAWRAKKRRMCAANADSPGRWAVADNPYAPSPLPSPSSPVQPGTYGLDGSSQRCQRRCDLGLTVPAFQWVSLFQTPGWLPALPAPILHHESGSTSTKTEQPHQLCRRGRAWADHARRLPRPRTACCLVRILMIQRPMSRFTIALCRITPDAGRMTQRVGRSLISLVPAKSRRLVLPDASISKTPAMATIQCRNMSPTRRARPVRRLPM